MLSTPKAAHSHQYRAMGRSNSSTDVRGDSVALIRKTSFVAGWDRPERPCTVGGRPRGPDRNGRPAADGGDAGVPDVV
jgi:hypothetical protein